MHRQSSGRGARGSFTLFREQCQPHAVRDLPGRWLFHRFGRGGGGLQTRDRQPLQTIRHVLVRTGRSKHPGVSLHPQQPPLGGVLETSPQCQGSQQRLPSLGSLIPEICLTPVAIPHTLMRSLTAIVPRHGRAVSKPAPQATDAFTLVELLVAIAIIARLASLVIPPLGSPKLKVH